MKMNFSKERAQGVIDVGLALVDAHEGGFEWTQSDSENLARILIDRYADRIRAELSKVGLVIDEGEQINPETVLYAVNRRTGLEISEWSPDAVKLALDDYMTRRVSQALGVDIGSLNDIEGVKAALLESAKQAVLSGKPSQFVSRGMIGKMQRARAFVDGGVALDDRKKVMARWYGAKYRKSHKQVWMIPDGL